MTVVQDETCAWVIVPMINPLPVADDWTILSDGSIAILRATDNRIDWLRADGSRAQSAPVPFTSKRLSLDEKVAFVDSTRAALEKLRYGPDRGARAEPEARPACDASRVTSIHIFKPETVSDPSSFAAYEGRTPPPLLFVSPSSLPDVVPAFGPGSTRADMENHLWIRTSQGLKNGAIYLVVNREGQVIARMVMPPGRVIVGFGPNHVVYLAVSENGAVRLERARYD